MELFQKPPTAGSFFLLYNLIFIYFSEYETFVRSSAWSFGHSGPDPSSVYSRASHPVLFSWINRALVFNGWVLFHKRPPLWVWLKKSGKKRMKKNSTHPIQCRGNVGVWHFESVVMWSELEETDKSLKKEKKKIFSL